MKETVYLVGAGPGDPELLTVKAARLLQTADVILHDALVSPAILALASPAAEVVNVGKRCGNKQVTQEQINRQLVEFASRGKLVVRLKSGDPLIFGRAGEEIHALREAGIEVEIVPGITSAVAAASAARIPLTDRRYAEQVLFLSGHCAEGKESTPWNAAISDRTTIVVYMPGDYLRVTEKLIAAGVSREMPCLILSRICSPDQHILATTVAGMSSLSRLDSPSMLIVGDVVGVHDFPDGGKASCNSSSAKMESARVLFAEQ
jgi:uroporphyrin-III C-methyltransferase